MKLLYVSESIGVSETFIAECSRGLSKKFEFNHIVSTEPSYKEEIKYQVVNFEVSDNLSHYLNYFLEERGKKLAYLLRKRKVRKKLDNYIKCADVVFVDYGTTAVKLLPVIKRYRKPMLVHFHGFDISSQLKSYWYQKDLIKLYKEGSSFIAASFHIKRLLVLNGCPEEKIQVVRYGISIQKELLKFKKSYLDRENSFIFIGRLTLKKNPLALIHAFYITQKSYPEIKLHLVGDGPLRKDCEELILKLNLFDKVKMHGSLPHKEAMELLRTCKIYVQHSVTSVHGDQEGFAISLSEAALMEMPVVSTLHNGIPENVIDGRTGYLVREFDYETMAEKMIFLLNNPEIAEKMGKEGFKYISGLCSNERRLEEIERLIRLAVNDR